MAMGCQIGVQENISRYWWIDQLFSRHTSSSRRMEPVPHSCRTTTWRLLWKSGLMGVIMTSLLGPSAFCLTAKLRSSTLRWWERTEGWIFHSLYRTNGIM
jgi:hypothetical protein